MWSSSREREDEAMSKTEEFLKEAFVGESQTNPKYLAFAAKADQEGFPQVARLFRAAARSMRSAQFVEPKERCSKG